MLRIGVDKAIAGARVCALRYDKRGSAPAAASTCAPGWMTGMATLMAARRDRWNGTLITLFQSAEETGEGAQDMVNDGLFKRIPVPDVALAQHMQPTLRTGAEALVTAAHDNDNDRSTG
jgi:hypothetical protein